MTVCYLYDLKLLKGCVKKIKKNRNNLIRPFDRNSLMKGQELSNVLRTHGLVVMFISFLPNQFAVAFQLHCDFRSK